MTKITYHFIKYKKWRIDDVLSQLQNITKQFQIKYAILSFVPNETISKRFVSNETLKNTTPNVNETFCTIFKHCEKAKKLQKNEWFICCASSSTTFLKLGDAIFNYFLRVSVGLLLWCVSYRCVSYDICNAALY